MKIAMFTDTYLPTKDGVVTSILTSKNQLEKKGHEVIIFAPEPSNSEKEDDVYYYKSKAFKKYPGYNLPIYIENKTDVLKEMDIDVIHCHALAFMALRSMFNAKKTEKPIIVTFHTMVTDAVKYYNPIPMSEEKAEKLIWIYLNKLLTHADNVIAPTEVIKKELYSKIPEIKNIDVVPTGIDCMKLSPEVDGSEIRNKYGIQNKKVLLHLGRVAREKNMELVMESLSNCIKKDKDLVLLVVGSGPGKEYYMDYAKRLKLDNNIIFTGFVTDEDLPKYYASCDAFITASKFETQGLTTLEAMACGKPVAGIRYRATAEIVHDGENGYLFEDDIESCTEAIFKVIDRNDEMRMNARTTSEEYSSEKCVLKLLQSYEYAINCKKERISRR